MAGLKKPDISILSDELLAEVKDLPQRIVAVELLRKILAGEIQSRSKKNVVQARSFANLLKQSIRHYQNRAIETAQVIEELIKLAKDMRKATKRGEDLGLNDEEIAFYDALGANNSAVHVLGDETLRTIARELVEAVKGNVTIDWTQRENVRARLRTIVKRILRKYGYPPDKQEVATRTVLEQAGCSQLVGPWIRRSTPGFPGWTRHAEITEAPPKALTAAELTVMLALPHPYDWVVRFGLAAAGWVSSEDFMHADHPAPNIARKTW
jgi:hypothetical protein